MSDSEFICEKTLGEGAFGKVYLVKDKNTSEKYAMKVIDLKKSPPDERDLALKEARLLSDFHHDNILRYIESFEDNGALCIVTEFCDGGDLSEYLESRAKKALPENRIVEWFKQICSALDYLHDRRVLHRDIKTQNVFLTGRNKDAKLGDLGLAKVLERPNAKAVTFCGSPYYMSPELFACKPYDSKSDVWALGVCVYEMATLERPFDAMLMQQLVYKIVHGQLPPMPTDKYSPELVTLMKRMLEKESEKRPSAADLLKDPIFKNVARPKTPPPKPAGAGAKAADGGKKGNIALLLKQSLKKMEDEDRNRFDMGSLMQSLNKCTQKKLGPPPAAKKYEVGAVSVLQSTYVSSKLIAESYEDKGPKKKLGKNLTKTVKSFKGDKTLQGEKTLTGSDINVDLNATNASSGSDEAGATGGGDGGFVGGPTKSPAEMLQLVVRTLTAFFPKNEDGERQEGALHMQPMDSRNMAPDTLMLYQIEQLQQHCVRVLGGDVQKFRRAYDLLDVTDNDMELEEKLIKLLTPEVFAACGVQLFYCKNFEYNLQKFQNPQGNSEA